jgi:glyoxylase-like metal-dependent hydrolase (beta-lactamase superfamily II)
VSGLQVHRTEHPGWLSNAYLVVNGAERRGVLIDGNGVPDPLLERIAAEQIAIEAILLTHHHPDHVVLDAYRPLGTPIYAHARTAELAGIAEPVRALADSETLELAGLRIEALHTPGHAADHTAYLINDSDCFTADVIFKGTVGGTRALAATGIADLRASLERLLALPGETRLHPGHREPTTVAAELAGNPFVHALRADEAPAGEPCTVADKPAELLLWGPDYDGTHKAWIRLADGSEHIVGGSQVRRA